MAAAVTAAFRQTFSSEGGPSSLNGPIASRRRRSSLAPVASWSPPSPWLRHHLFERWAPPAAAATAAASSPTHTAAGSMGADAADNAEAGAGGGADTADSATVISKQMQGGPSTDLQLFDIAVILVAILSCAAAAPSLVWSLDVGATREANSWLIGRAIIRRSRYGPGPYVMPVKFYYPVLPSSTIIALGLILFWITLVATAYSLYFRLKRSQPVWRWVVLCYPVVIGVCGARVMLANVLHAVR